MQAGWLEQNVPGKGAVQRYGSTFVEQVFLFRSMVNVQHTVQAPRDDQGADKGGGDQQNTLKASELFPERYRRLYLAGQCLLSHSCEEQETKAWDENRSAGSYSHKAHVAHLRTSDTLLGESLLDPGLLILSSPVSSPLFFLFFTSFFPLFILLLFIIIMCNIYINFHV